MNAHAPTFEARGARISVGDAVAIERLDYRSSGDRVVLYGDVTALIAAISGLPLGPADDTLDDDAGEARVSAGTISISGASVEQGAHFGVVGIAPLDPPLPAQWSAADYVTWSLRLGGLPNAAARLSAMSALQQVGMMGAATRKIGLLAHAERRVLLLALAIGRQPRALVLEHPLADLEGEAAAFVGAAMAAATQGRQAIVSVRRIDAGTPEGAVARTATDLVIFNAGALVVGESPGRILTGARLYALRVSANAQALGAELAARGIELTGGPSRFSVALPEGASTDDVLGAASRARAPVWELVPLL